jgi:hypothetical protein
LRKPEFNEAGAELVGISVDSPGQHAAWIAQEGLNFPILSDPDRSLAITPYGVANPTDRREIALPATIVVDASGHEAGRIESSDFAERPHEDLTLEMVRSLGLAPVDQPDPAAGTPEAGKALMPLGSLRAYFRGAKFAAVAMGRRFPVAEENAKAYAATMDRYIEAVGEMRAQISG